MTNQAAKKSTVSILGCGWYGMALAQKLIGDGYLVKGSTTSQEKLLSLKAMGIIPYLANFELGNIIFDADLFESEILIISIPPKSKSPDLSSYPTKIKAIATAAKSGSIKQLIFISSTGVYPDGNTNYNENDPPLPRSDPGQMMYAAELALQEETPFTTTILRFAGLIGPNRTLTKHFAGRTGIANGLAVVNLIHLSDCVGLTQAIIEQKAFGNTYHGVAPDHPTRADFYTKNCLAHGLAKPQFIQELITWKQIDSINVPKLLNYQYQLNNWNDWLEIACSSDESSDEQAKI